MGAAGQSPRLWGIKFLGVTEAVNALNRLSYKIYILNEMLKCYSNNTDILSRNSTNIPFLLSPVMRTLSASKRSDFTVWRLRDAVVFVIMGLQIRLKAEMFPHFSCSCECEWDKDALFPLVSRGEYEFIIDDFDSCGLANFLIKVFDSAADSCCYLSRRPLAAPNERKNSLGGKIVVTLTSRAP